MKDNSTSKILFSEIQYFRQWWMRLIMVFIAFYTLAIIFTNASLLHWPLKFLFVLLLMSPLLLSLMNLKIEIREDGIYIRFTPFHLRFHKIAFSEIKSYEARTYRPIVEYGGWGIRYGLPPGRNKAYNVLGNKGVELELKNGKRLLIGTQKPDEFIAALNIATKVQ